MFIILGILGLLILSFAVWLRNERKQDLWFVIGGILLLIYSISINNVIFTILQIVFITSALIELVKLARKNARTESK
jgi:asparagine N-glycosylation enzyme membrane subunit Stt3